MYDYSMPVATFILISSRFHVFLCVCVLCFPPGCDSQASISQFHVYTLVGDSVVVDQFAEGIWLLYRVSILWLI